jgi:Pyruvate/2-oxoacid:ferredoxin oxidoreductase delta subunit
MEEIYEKLRQHFNEGATTKLRKTKEIMKILEILFTLEQAEYAMILPLTVMGRISLNDLASKMNKGSEEVEQAVEAMAKEGKVLVMTSRKDGKKYYALWPLLPGILESTYADGIDNDQRRRLGRLLEKYVADGLWNELASSDYPQFRIIPINKTLSAASQVLPFEEVNQIIEQAEVITVIPCLCRTVSRKCDHLLEADFVFGAWAEYLINYRGARKWTKEEALQRLIECEKDGLMHLTGNAQEGSGVICNCCTCCCKALRGFTELHNPRSFVRSNFEPEINHEKCTLCLKCARICQMGALTKLPGYAEDGSDSKMLLHASQCVGCGLCASHCPEDAIQMIKIRDYLPAKTLREMNERYLQEKVW